MARAAKLAQTGCMVCITGIFMKKTAAPEILDQEAGLGSKENFVECLPSFGHNREPTSWSTRAKKALFKHGRSSVVLSIIMNLLALVLLRTSDFGSQGITPTFYGARRLLEVGKERNRQEDFDHSIWEWYNKIGGETLWSQPAAFWRPKLPKLLDLFKLVPELVEDVFADLTHLTWGTLQKWNPPDPCFKNVRSFFTKKHLIVDYEPPSVVFPNFAELERQHKDAEIEQHQRYYRVALLICLAVYSFLGWLLTKWRNRCASQHSYQHVGEGYIEGLNGLGYVGVALAFWFIMYAFAIPMLVMHGCITEQHIFCGEAALIWVTLHYFFGLLELALSRRQGKVLSSTLYPWVMLTSLLPFGSEKFDTVKDFIVAVLAANRNNPVVKAVGWICFFGLCLVHVTFLNDGGIRGIMLETYLPILLAEPKIPKEGEEQGWSEWMKSFFAWERIKVLFWDQVETLTRKPEKWLLKWSSNTRFRIACYEDIPQSIAAIVLVYWGEKDVPLQKQGSMIFCLSFNMSKVVLTFGLMNWVKRRMLRHRSKAIDDERIDKAVNISRELWYKFGNDVSDEIFLEKNVNITDLLDAGLRVDEVRKVGYGKFVKHYEDLLKRGLNAKDIHEAGFDNIDCYRGSKWPVEELKEVFGIHELRNAGFTIEEMLGGFSFKELLDLGIDEEDLKKAGFSIKEFKAAGHSFSRMMEIFTLDEINTAFTSKEIMDENARITEEK